MMDSFTEFLTQSDRTGLKRLFKVSLSFQFCSRILIFHLFNSLTSDPLPPTYPFFFFNNNYDGPREGTGPPKVETTPRQSSKSRDWS